MLYTKSNLNFIKKFAVFFILSSWLAGNAIAQTSINTTDTAGYNRAGAFCPYVFQKNLYIGTTDIDVKVLQQILNTDTRTMISRSGIASPGSETNYFGSATKEAVKVFQALFIEYVGIANGNFGPKTRTVMNAVCNGDSFTSGSTDIYGGISTQNTNNNS